MANFKLDLTIDPSFLKNLTDQVKEVLQSKVEAATEELATSAYGKIVEMAQEQLHSTKNMYIDNLSLEQVGQAHWKVTLAEPAVWIEEGRKSGDMLDDLLKNGAKTSKEGFRYKVIPFNHSTLPQNQTQKQKDITSLLKTSMEKQGIPWSTIERTAVGVKGIPMTFTKLGKLHSFDVASPKPSVRASHPALSGVNIYQTQTASGNVRRDAMTFRVASEKQRGQKWIHPGTAPKNFFEKVYEEVKTEWETVILPDILKK